MTTSEARKRFEESQIANAIVSCGLSHDIPFVYGRSVGEIFVEFAEFCPRCGKEL